MLDGIYAERIEIPSAVICTELFMEQGMAAAQVQGYRDYKIVKVSHPIATAHPHELKQEAKRVTEEVISILTQE